MKKGLGFCTSGQSEISTHKVCDWIPSNSSLYFCLALMKFLICVLTLEFFLFFLYTLFGEIGNLHYLPDIKWKVK